jgi:HTH-type transcriptional regulator/antitoxin HigA
VGVFETASVASAVLNGRRELTKDHIKRLSQKFDVSPELFF